MMLARPLKNEAHYTGATGDGSLFIRKTGNRPLFYFTALFYFTESHTLLSVE